MWTVLLLPLLILLLQCGLATVRPCWALEPCHLRIENQFSPPVGAGRAIVVDVARPRFSWQFCAASSAGRGLFQHSFQLEVFDLVAAPAGEKRVLLWDSGVVRSRRQTNVEFGEFEDFQSPLRPMSRLRVELSVWPEMAPAAAAGRSSGMGPPESPFMGEKRSLLADFETGLMCTRGEEGDNCWGGALWISRNVSAPKTDCSFYEDRPAPRLRKTFMPILPWNRLRSARLYTTGLGYQQVSLNGEVLRKDTDVLGPGWTSYNRTVLYSTFNVTKHLRAGGHSSAAAPALIEVMLGRGWFQPLPLRFWGSLNLRQYLAHGEPMSRSRLVMDFEDTGADQRVIRQEVLSDLSWSVRDSEIIRNNIYLGEVIDKRDRRAVSQAAVRDAGDQLPQEEVLFVAHEQSVPPTSVLEEYPADSLWNIGASTVFDAGTNRAAGVRLRVPGPTRTGQTIRLVYGEILWPNRTVNPLTGVAGQIKRPGEGGPCSPSLAVQQDVFICRGGEDDEIFETTFTFHGFRYAQLTTDAVTAENKEARRDWRREDLTVRRLSTDVRNIGEFSSTSPLLSDINRMVRNSVRSNFGSGIQSDCPTRERFGYGGDLLATAASISQQYDTALLYEKRVRDFADSVRSNGGITETAPFNGLDSSSLGGDSGPIGWGTAFTSLQVLLWRQVRNKRLVEEMFPVTKRWVAFILSVAQEHGGIIPMGLGDWSSIAKRDVAFTSSSFLVHNLESATWLAEIAGDAAVAREWREETKRARESITKHFANGVGKFASGTQADQAFALEYGLAQHATEEDQAFELMLSAVREAGDHFTTGIFGTPFLLKQLSKHGRADLAFRLLSQTSYPSFGFMLSKNATSLWEVWHWSNSTYSHNHAMFGSSTEWFFALGGIHPRLSSLEPDPVFDVEPQLLPPELLAAVNTSINTIVGRFESSWKWDNKYGELQVVIPLNCESRLLLPNGTRLVLTPGKHKFQFAREDVLFSSPEAV